jgi:hypothetical protein
MEMPALSNLGQLLNGELVGVEQGGARQVVEELEDLAVPALALQVGNLEGLTVLQARQGGVSALPPRGRPLSGSPEVSR